MSGNSPGGWGPPQGPPGPWGAPPQGGPGPQGPGQQQSWGNPSPGGQPQAAPGYGPPPGVGYGAPPGAYGAPPGAYGPPQGTFGAPTYGAPYGGNPYGPPASPGFAGYQSSSDTTTWALVMAILSWFTCGCLLSIPAFFMARSELASIDRGEVGANNRGNAQAAYWLAAINAGICILAVAMYVFFMLFAIGVSAGAPR